MKIVALFLILSIVLVQGKPQYGNTEFHKIGQSYGGILDRIVDAIRTTITSIVAPLAVPTTPEPKIVYANMI